MELRIVSIPSTESSAAGAMRERNIDVMNTGNDLQHDRKGSGRHWRRHSVLESARQELSISSLASAESTVVESQC